MIGLVTALLMTTTLLGAADAVLPRPAPVLGIQTAPQKYLWLGDYKGKTCVVAFILTTCSHCQYTTGVLNKIQRDYAGQVQILVSAIEPMSSLNIPDFQKRFAPAFPVGYNEQTYAAKFLGVPENDPMFVPQIVIVDKNGNIREQLTGDDKRMLPDVQEKNLRQILDATIKEGRPASRPAAPK